ncbi:MAG: LPP20 family lipoprotein [Gammaproteobacteria bacterium]|nr:LPP20 family lipoprotein [Gammaproteobacteria bacterium]
MRYLLTFMMLFFVSIVEASPAPDWVLGRGHPSYDSSQYLIGVGYSKENTVSASESARAELIKSIRVKVNSTIKDYRSTDKSFSEASISSESDFLLEGSQVKDGWYDEDKEVFYSLVVIKRQFVLDTLSEMINNIVSKNSLTLRQADTFYNNGKIIKALVYYYDGYVESSKLLPYIQTYKSVILVSNNTVTETNYNLLFKEKIQNIVEHIQLEKISGSIQDDDVLLNVKATYKGRGIDNFPVKFFSVYKHHVDRVICKSDGCETKAPVKSILNKNNSIFIKAVPDFQTFEKYFTYNLTPILFGSFDVLSVSFKDTLQNQEVISRNKNYKKLNDELDNRQQRESDRLAIQMEREINAMKSSGCEVGCRRPQIPIYGNSPRRRGSINFNIGFGKGRNRGNINIGKGW